MLTAKKSNDPLVEARLDAVERKTWPAKYKRLVRTCILYYGDEDNNCSVYALALALDVSYGKAHAALSRAGRENGKGVTMNQIIKAGAELGAVIAPLVTEESTAPTLARVRDTYAKYNPVMAVMKGRGNQGHVCTVVDGAIYDFNGSRKRVQHMYGVIRGEA